MCDVTQPNESELDEEIRDFGRRFARLVISRGFEGTCTEAEGVGQVGDAKAAGFKSRPQSALDVTVADAESSLRASQRLAMQLEDDADALRFRVLPSLRENARQLQALFVAIDRVSDQVLPEIETAVAKMERAMYQMEEMRKEQVEIGSRHGSYGLGSPWGAGLWAPRTGGTNVSLPEVFETNKIFHLEGGGLRPL